MNIDFCVLYIYSFYLMKIQWIHEYLLLFWLYMESIFCNQPSKIHFTTCQLIWLFISTAETLCRNKIRESLVASGHPEMGGGGTLHWTVLDGSKDRINVNNNYNTSRSRLVHSGVLFCLSRQGCRYRIYMSVDKISLVWSRRYLSISLHEIDIRWSLINL